MEEEWLTATLAQKVSPRVGNHGLQSAGRLLSREVSGLKTDWEFSVRQGWLEVRARGADAAVFLSLLKEKFGETLPLWSEVRRWDFLPGYVVGAGRYGFGVYVDLGIVQPSRRDALYPLHRMRAQLADGAVKPCREILKENVLVDDFPVRVVITAVGDGKATVELADETRNMFASWKKLPFERVIAIGATSEIVEGAVRAAKLEQDIIRIEPLSMFGQCIVCKRGTEAPGILARIGTRLKGVNLVTFRAALPSLALTTH